MSSFCVFCAESVPSFSYSFFLEENEKQEEFEERLELCFECSLFGRLKRYATSFIVMLEKKPFQYLVKGKCLQKKRKREKKVR